MNEALVTNWNSVVKEDDIVFVLGDLGFCGYDKLSTKMHLLKDNLILHPMFERYNLRNFNYLAQMRRNMKDVRKIILNRMYK